MLSWLGLSVSQHEVVRPREGMCWKEHGESRTHLISRVQSWLNMQEPFLSDVPSGDGPEAPPSNLWRSGRVLSEGCALWRHIAYISPLFTPKQLGRKLSCVERRIKLLSHTHCLKIPPCFLVHSPIGLSPFNHKFIWETLFSLDWNMACVMTVRVRLKYMKKCFMNKFCI